MKKGRQPTGTTGMKKKPNQPIITKGVRKTPSKVSKASMGIKPRVPRVPGRRKPARKKTLPGKGRRLSGKSKKKFDEIPDSASQFSKITGNRSKNMKKKMKPEKKLTEKPTNIRMDGNMAVIEEREIPSVMNPGRREVTDKPNNIRGPIKPPMF